MYTSTLTHHRDCNHFWDLEEERNFELRISFNGFLLQGTVEAAMSMTHSPGGCSIGPMLAFSRFVPSDAGAFKLPSVHYHHEISAAEMQEAFCVRKQKLLHLFQQRKASPRDIDENGDTIMH
ncbi:MAG: hypothetical protein M1835_003774, partial [Candelina submexicana]